MAPRHASRVPGQTPLGGAGETPAAAIQTSPMVFFGHALMRAQWIVRVSPYFSRGTEGVR
jgi:hypothetical protein